MARHCPECGFVVTEGANYCQRCGAYVGTREEHARRRHDRDVHDRRADRRAAAGRRRRRRRARPARSSSAPAAAGSASRSRSSGERLTIGRSPDAEIFLDDVTVSRDHAVLVRRSGDVVTWTTPGSLNGTYVNRRRIESHKLEDGDELQVGKYKLTYLAR